MANNSSKKNQIANKGYIKWLTIITYALIIWFLGYNSFKLISEEISIWHQLLAIIVCLLSYVCTKQTINCWQLGLPSEAAQYYYDVLFMNFIVMIGDPFTHYVWHVYWLILAYIVWKALVWLWDYITPKFEEPVDEEQEQKLRKKKEKKEKVKYSKH